MYSELRKHHFACCKRNLIPANYAKRFPSRSLFKVRGIAATHSREGGRKESEKVKQRAKELEIYYKAILESSKALVRSPLWWSIFFNEEEEEGEGGGYRNRK